MADVRRRLGLLLLLSHPRLPRAPARVSALYVSSGSGGHGMVVESKAAIRRAIRLSESCSASLLYVSAAFAFNRATSRSHHFQRARAWAGNLGSRSEKILRSVLELFRPERQHANPSDGQ